jgi:hypothetical protein
MILNDHDLINLPQFEELNFICSRRYQDYFKCKKCDIIINMDVRHNKVYVYSKEINGTYWFPALDFEQEEYNLSCNEQILKDIIK